MLPRRRRSRESSLLAPVAPVLSLDYMGLGAAESLVAVPEEPELPVSTVGEVGSPSDETGIPGIFSDELEHNRKPSKDVYATDKAGRLGKSKPSKTTTDKNNVMRDIQAKFTASKSSPLWERSIIIAEQEYWEILEDWDRLNYMSVLTVFSTVFAGLFSAISTGFLLESSKNLQSDPAVATVLAIQELTSVVQSGFQIPTSSSPGRSASLGTPFKPSTVSVWVNCLWFFSLGLSISVSLFAMLAKRWGYKSRSMSSGTSYERAIRLQEWDASQKWKLELLIEQLPTVMHVALITFFIGLVLYLSEIHKITMIVTAVPIGLTLVAYGTLTVLPVWSPTFPMATPFTPIVTSFTRMFQVRYPWIQPYFLKLRRILHLEGWTHVFRSASLAIRRLFTATYHSRMQNQSYPTATGSPLVADQWVLSGCSKPSGKTSVYPRTHSDEQRHAFLALMCVIQGSNIHEGRYVAEVLEYIERFPEVILSSFASSQELCNATLAVLAHLQLLKNDPIEFHHLNATRLTAKCGRFIYLSARPWLHSTNSADNTQAQLILDLSSIHSPSMSFEEVDDLIQDIMGNRFDATTCVPWLEAQAIKMAFGCLPEAGFRVCGVLHEWVQSKIPADVDKEEIYSTLSWMLLNLAIDASGSGKFWPAPSPNLGSPTPHESDRAPLPTALCDSMLTLSYFRDSEKRMDSSWLKVVGLSGVLNMPTYYLSEDIDIEPDIPLNHEFYAGIIKLLRAALAPASQLSSAAPGEVDPYFGKLPVYWESDLRLYEFDSLHYCFDALERAYHYARFAEFHNDLNELKNLIPEARRGRVVSSGPKSEVDIAGPNTQSLHKVHDAEAMV
ncbi:unnamed protein product [Rhizoctonia solani]|uniref:DUF6535 domain-containing protein n=1 Tax=Rhizoctonia solani TaxID=456999 RepID=A0A8H3HKD6_9AGAM|nr:unnamed protein product [Rhizoctonia solani]